MKPVTHVDTRPFDRLLLAGALLLGFLLLGPILQIPLHIPLSYNEGWNAFFDARAITPGTGPLYPPESTFIFNNYPPLSFYIVGALGRFVFHDMIVAGRTVALLSLLASACLLGVCVRRLGGCRRAAFAAGVLMPLFAAAYYGSYVAMDDPQWLGHAIMLSGLAVLLHDWPDRRIGLPSVVAAALLILAGGLVKHSLMALPLAITAWLAWIDRRAAVAWLATATIGLTTALGISEAVYGRQAFASILEHHRVIRIGPAINLVIRLLPFAPMAVVTAILARGRRDPEMLFAALFAGFATVIGSVQRFGEGVYYNAQFETLVAICLAFGLAISPLFDRPTPLRGRRQGPATLCAIAALPLPAFAWWFLPHAWTQIHDSQTLVAQWRPVIAQIAAAPGPAGCEMISLCWWAGKPFRLDMFNETQSMLRGTSTASFRAAVAEGDIAILQYDPKSFTHQDAVRALGYDPILSVFAGTYAQVGSGPGGIVLLAPNTTISRRAGR